MAEPFATLLGADLAEAAQRRERANADRAQLSDALINRQNKEPVLVPPALLLREALSSTDSAFAKLVRRGQPGLSAEPESLQVNREKPRAYRQLNTDDLKEITTLYEAGESMAKLAEKFECHRHTIMRNLQKAGIEIRPQKLMTHELVARAATLYEQDHTLEDIGRLLGLEASTIGKALKRTGVTLRPPVADRWHEALPD